MRISEIQILSDDLIGTAKFYTEVLNFKQLHADEEKVSFAAGASTLTFLRSENVHPVYHFAFNISPLQLQQALAWTKARTAVLPVAEDGQEIADFVDWNARAFYYKDNNGNILEFIARYNLDVKTEEPFDSSSIISISEIGIVTDDVPAERKSISEKYNVPIFSKPPLPDNFTAIGDDHGLFILSKTHRPWHPNEVPAASYWGRTLFESNGIQYELSTETR
jgi:catechol-2,3-dioxygenase